MMYFQLQNASLHSAEAGDCKVSPFLEFELVLNQEFPRLFCAIPNMSG